MCSGLGEEVENMFNEDRYLILFIQVKATEFE